MRDQVEGGEVEGGVAEGMGMGMGRGISLEILVFGVCFLFICLVWFLQVC